MHTKNIMTKATGCLVIISIILFTSFLQWLLIKKPTEKDIKPTGNVIPNGFVLAILI